ncbi:helix-turn-helix domain-containing protein [Vitiosangium sp. GDMCC 1.1324]|uniref:helix-turn-helix domain-containing protein n=1 Tax=Vitiosangium sp. (strain GDMCC 1.1324) TaxID=2138576 RepID=UPI000D35B8BA|nr:helix-turn-helix domain-containing protein [Vitiosangium sp. GDMCC 1.1324]PTL83722.1 hypothetical protein DAT35_09595 [Vitiosangium sp. GDMCC 1.1324]
MASESLNLLLAQADTRRPALAQGLPPKTAEQAPSPEKVEGHLRDVGGDPNSLPDQRWGLVVPEGREGDRLLALLEPLKRKREEDQQAPARVYRLPASLGAQGKLEDFHLWKRSVLEDESVPESEWPHYLLLLGDFDQVPFELQQALYGDRLVGRLAFRQEQDYASYVDKVLRCERAAASASQPRTLFYTVRDGTHATTLGYEMLVKPSIQSTQEQHELGRFPSSGVLEIGEPGQDCLDTLLAEAAVADPSLLFSMSHGLGSPRGGWRNPQEQRELQGALSLGEADPLTAADLKVHMDGGKSFLHGGIWFLFACFGAGTPVRSAFHPWLHQLQQAGQFRDSLQSVLASLPRQGERPFVAALPQTALAHSRGPLAVFGHVDLAWTYGFQDRDTRQGKVSRFLEPLRQLASRRRAGVALDRMMRDYSQANGELTTLYDREEANRSASRPTPIDLPRRAHLWMVRQDLAGYMLLGDPAVQLPLGSQDSRSATPPVASPERVASFSSSAPEPRPEPLPPPVPWSTPPVPRSTPPAPPSPLADEPPRAINVPSSLAASEIEHHLLELLFQRRQFAQYLGVSLQQLDRWEQEYRRAGRAALLPDPG